MASVQNDRQAILGFGKARRSAATADLLAPAAHRRDRVERGDQLKWQALL